MLGFVVVQGDVHGSDVKLGLTTSHWSIRA